MQQKGIRTVKLKNMDSEGDLALFFPIGGANFAYISNAIASRTCPFVTLHVYYILYMVMF